MLRDQARGIHSAMSWSKPTRPGLGLSTLTPAGANPNAAAVSRVSRMCR
ncbi:hypothetical protein HMPREF9336_04074 [Segniliparus rugosus ATCC BAA-974]|uniref:Uncharacterized protein n=1 Tax=Segniliparus rugosus (strain ATCC BAA-974 / DSM 45345 / CCUG 50838 / CIP 108380 / JCM 13579 / CDC 945) TaxID=679197 RepID=U1N9A4_SEGRC|nr:hypothetical protein HMPREF9336_04074 [Segniliparus rugosus ATCC BAA-974]